MNDFIGQPQVRDHVLSLFGDEPLYRMFPTSRGASRQAVRKLDIVLPARRLGVQTIAPEHRPYTRYGFVDQRIRDLFLARDHGGRWGGAVTNGQMWSVRSYMDGDPISEWYLIEENELMSFAEQMGLSDNEKQRWDWEAKAIRFCWVEGGPGVRCTDCHKTKPVAEIRKNRAKTEGVDNLCLVCSSNRSKNYVMDPRNSRKIAAYHRSYRARQKQKTDATV